MSAIIDNSLSNLEEILQGCGPLNWILRSSERMSATWQRGQRNN